ncbi:MAG: hypothetical protein ACJATT_002068, partial [Myxococcota bacterium]
MDGLRPDDRPAQRCVQLHNRLCRTDLQSTAHVRMPNADFAQTWERLERYEVEAVEVVSGVEAY